MWGKVFAFASVYMRKKGEAVNSTRACSDCLALAELARLIEPKCLQLFLERLSEKCARDNPERQYGICSIHCSWHCSCRTYFCCFPLALADICTLPLLPFFQISLKNSELKTTHTTFRGCRVHFIRQPFSKHSCIWRKVSLTTSVILSVKKGWPGKDGHLSTSRANFVLLK